MRLFASIAWAGLAVLSACAGGGAAPIDAGPLECKTFYPTQEEFDTVAGAVETELTAEGFPADMTQWANASMFWTFVDRVEKRFGCIHSSGEASSALEYDASVGYCGKNGPDGAPTIAVPATWVGDGTNHACFDHDACYDACGLSLLCYWSAQTKTCDEVFFDTLRDLPTCNVLCRAFRRWTMAWSSHSTCRCLDALPCGGKERPPVAITASFTMSDDACGGTCAGVSNCAPSCELGSCPCMSGCTGTPCGGTIGHVALSVGGSIVTEDDFADLEGSAAGTPGELSALLKVPPACVTVELSHVAGADVSHLMDIRVTGDDVTYRATYPIVECGSKTCSCFAGPGFTRGVAGCSATGMVP